MIKKRNSFAMIIIVLVISFFLNLLWEVAQSPLYDWNALPLQNNVRFIIPKILLCTLGDVMYIFIMLLLISLFRKGFLWVMKPGKVDYIALVTLGIVFAVFIEIKAKVLRLWSYNSYMPLVFGIGLTPLIQLAITSMLSLFIANKVIFKMKGGNKS